MAGGWKRVEVGIAVPGAPPAMWIDATTSVRKVGAARFFARWHDEDRLLVLRASIPVRATDPTPGRTAVTKAATWWSESLMFVTILDPPDLAMWSWIPTDK